MPLYGRPTIQNENFFSFDDDKKLVECITEKSYWQTLLYSAFFATNREVEKTCCGRVKKIVLK